jgi:hypothetical protein
LDIQGREERKQPLSGLLGTNSEITEHKKIRIKRSERGRGGMNDSKKEKEKNIG